MLTNPDNRPINDMEYIIEQLTGGPKDDGTERSGPDEADECINL